MKRLATAALLLSLGVAPPARAELVAPGIADGKLAVAADGTPRVAWLAAAQVVVARRAETWTTTVVGRVPSSDARVAGLAADAVLVESRRGSWIRLLVRRASGWRTLTVADAPKRALLGSSGLAVDRGGRPAVAYSLQEADERTSLYVVQLGADGKLRRTRVTRQGFPRSRRPPAAQPVLWPNGTLRVVQSFTQRGSNALLWRREGKRWWGRVLYSSLLGATERPLYAAAPGGETFYLAWTSVQPDGASHLILSSRPPARSVVLHRNATVADLVVGAAGPEVAANESVAFRFGTATAGLLLGAVTAELDGAIVGYEPVGGARQLLLARRDGLEWFALPAPPAIRIAPDADAWRVHGATSGTVTIYEEPADGPRHAVFEAAVGPDGSFSFSLPFVQNGSYRAVYVDPATGVPYAYLLR